jgi:hypothetical protein
LQAITPGGQEGHATETQEKTREDAAEKNDDDHVITSLHPVKYPGMILDGFAGYPPVYLIISPMKKIIFQYPHATGKTA